MSFEFFIAGRYLRARRKQAFISLITLLSIAGVALGVMALVVVIAVMTGAEADFRSRILGVESHLIVLRQGGAIPDYREVMTQIEERPGVRAVSPFVYSQAMLRSAAGVSGAVLRGIDPVLSSDMVKGYDETSLKKKLVSEAGKPGMILGKELARGLGVRPGDTIYLISPRGMLSPMGHVPSMKRFHVSGIFESGMYEYDGSLAYIHMTEAQKIMRLGDAVTGLGVWVDEIYRAGEIGKGIAAELKFPFWTRDWMEMNRSLFSALKLEKAAMFVILILIVLVAAMFVILILIVLVAAFNIASTLIMMVMGKTRDIAILKAMGTSSRGIRKIFVINGMVIGAIGTTIGTAAGVALCWVLERYKFIELPEAYPFSTLPIKLEAPDVALISLSAMVICFLATLYPAYQAARLDPVEALRYG